MKAVVFDGSTPTLGIVADPAPAPGEALIRPTRLGIGSADLAVVAGRVRFRGVMGHEFVGVVEKVHAASPEQKKWEGRRVVGAPAVPCAACDLCRGGLSALCQSRKVLGLHERDGCWSERFCLPVGNLVEVPKVMADDTVIFAGVVAHVLHAAEVTRIEGKPYVTILGDSAEALVAAQALAKRNASVRLLGANPAKFTLCEKWGVKHRHASEVGRRRDQDIVFDFSGTSAEMRLAMELARPRGKIVTTRAPAQVPLSALGPSLVGVDLAPVVCNELEVIGAGAGTLREGVEALARGEVDVSSLVTKRIRFGDALAAIQEAQDPAAIRVLMDPAAR